MSVTRWFLSALFVAALWLRVRAAPQQQERVWYKTPGPNGIKGVYKGWVPQLQANVLVVYFVGPTGQAAGEKQAGIIVSQLRNALEQGGYSVAIVEGIGAGDGKSPLRTGAGCIFVRDNKGAWARVQERASLQRILSWYTQFQTAVPIPWE